MLDAIAVSQVTPGPVFTMATFIGYVLKGWKGAAVATVGIFLPSFLFVGLLGLVVPRLHKSPRMAAFLDGVNAGALALMAFVTWALSRAALVDPWTILLGLASAVLLRSAREDGETTIARMQLKAADTWYLAAGKSPTFAAAARHDASRNGQVKKEARKSGFSLPQTLDFTP